jgi:small ligand-binding sensory domain FIST
VLRAGAGLSTDRDADRAASEAATTALRAAGTERADLVILFATTGYGPAFGRLTRTATAICGTRDVIGCSAAGVLADETEIEAEAGVAVLVLAGDLEAHRFMVPMARGLGERAAEEIAGLAGPDPPRAIFVFADTYNLEAEPFFGRLAELLPGVPVIGGGASEDGSVGEVSVFAGDAASSRAVSGALIGGDVRVTVGVAQALRRVGRIHRVTAAEGNSVLALDGRPAWEAFREIVPEPLLADPRRALSVVLAGLSQEGETFVARHLVGLDVERGAVGVAAPVQTGSHLFFGVRDPLGAREGLQRMLAEQVASWPRPPAAALYVDCIGRGRAFYGVPGLDTAYIRQHLGAVPLAGFFSGAEFAPGSGAARLHQYTGVLTVLGTAG